MTRVTQIVTSIDVTTVCKLLARLLDKSIVSNACFERLKCTRYSLTLFFTEATCLIDKATN